MLDTYYGTSNIYYGVRLIMFCPLYRGCQYLIESTIIDSMIQQL